MTDSRLRDLRLSGKTLLLSHHWQVFFTSYALFDALCMPEARQGFWHGLPLAQNLGMCWQPGQMLAD